jgi:hypothetical protein
MRLAELGPRESVHLASTVLTMRGLAMAKATRKLSRRGSRQPAANGLLGDALSLASTFADTRKAASADRIAELASATRQFGASLNDPQLSRYGDQAAGSLDDLADYVAKTDIPEMLDDCVAFAMRKPVATLTLGVATGLAFTQLVYGWPLPRSRPRTTSNGRLKRRSRRRNPGA